MEFKNIVLDSMNTYAEVCSKLSGNSVKISELIGIPIVIWKYEFHKSIYRTSDKDPSKRYLKIQFSYESDLNQKFTTGTSSYYLASDIEDVKEYLPIRTTIIEKPLSRKNTRGEPKCAYCLS